MGQPSELREPFLRHSRGKASRRVKSSACSTCYRCRPGISSRAATGPSGVWFTGESVFPPAPYQRPPVDRRRSRKMLTLLTAAAPLVRPHGIKLSGAQPAGRHQSRPRSGGGRVPARRHSAVARNVDLQGSSSEGQTRRYFLALRPASTGCSSSPPRPGSNSSASRAACSTALEEWSHGSDREGDAWVAPGQTGRSASSAEIATKPIPLVRSRPGSSSTTSHSSKLPAKRSSRPTGSSSITPSGKIYFIDDLQPASWSSAAAARFAFKSPADNVLIKGLVIEKYYNPRPGGRGAGGRRTRQGLAWWSARSFAQQRGWRRGWERTVRLSPPKSTTTDNWARPLLVPTS